MANGKRPANLRAIVLALSFLSGAGVMILEICASRLLSPYFGNSIYVWGSLIGTILLSLSVGYFFGGILADRFPEEKWLAIGVAFAGSVVFLVPFLSDGAFSFSSRFGFVFGPLVASAIVFLPPSILLGAASPYSMKLLGSDASIGKSSGTLYAVSTAGSLVGTFLATFVLAPFLGTRETVLGLGAFLFFSGIFALLFFRRRKVIAISLLPVFLLSIFLLTNIASFGVSVPVPKGTFSIHSEESLYQRIVIAQGPSWGNATRPMRMLLTEGNFAGAVYPDAPEDTPFAYPNYFSLAYTIKPDIDSALFVGGGSFSMPRKFRSRNPSLEIDVVEIDPAIVDVSQRFLNLSSSPGFGIFINDGRVFLANSDKTYDFIAIDAYSGWTVPAHMLTREFFQLVNSRLSEEGLVAINLIGAIEGDRSAVIRLAVNTISEEFPSIYVFPVGGLLRKNQRSNLVIFASKNPSVVPSEILKKRAVELAGPLGLPRLPDYLNGYDPYWPRNSSENGIFTDNYSPVNNLVDPEISEFFLLG